MGGLITVANPGLASAPPLNGHLSPSNATCSNSPSTMAFERLSFAYAYNVFDSIVALSAQESRLAKLFEVQELALLVQGFRSSPAINQITQDFLGLSGAYESVLGRLYRLSGKAQIELRVFLESVSFLSSLYIYFSDASLVNSTPTSIRSGPFQTRVTSLFKRNTFLKWSQSCQK